MSIPVGLDLLCLIVKLDDPEILESMDRIPHVNPLPKLQRTQAMVGEINWSPPLNTIRDDQQWNPFDELIEVM